MSLSFWEGSVVFLRVYLKQIEKKVNYVLNWDVQDGSMAADVLSIRCTNQAGQTTTKSGEIRWNWLKCISVLWYLDTMSVLFYKSGLSFEEICGLYTWIMWLNWVISIAALPVITVHLKLFKLQLMLQTIGSVQFWFMSMAANCFLSVMQERSWVMQSLFIPR